MRNGEETRSPVDFSVKLMNRSDSATFRDVGINKVIFRTVMHDAAGAIKVLFSRKLTPQDGMANRTGRLVFFSETTRTIFSSSGIIPEVAVLDQILRSCVGGAQPRGGGEADYGAGGRSLREGAGEIMDAWRRNGGCVEQISGRGSAAWRDSYVAQGRASGHRLT